MICCATPCEKAKSAQRKADSRQKLAGAMIALPSLWPSVYTEVRDFWRVAESLTHLALRALLRGGDHSWLSLLK
jgi:hypothetical protein